MEPPGITLISGLCHPSGRLSSLISHCQTSSPTPNALMNRSQRALEMGTLFSYPPETRQIATVRVSRQARPACEKFQPVLLDKNNTKRTFNRFETKHQVLRWILLLRAPSASHVLVGWRAARTSESKICTTFQLSFELAYRLVPVAKE